ncbi:MAG: iron-sulfur cluster assembly scaffold protein [Chloroflexi bacterium]|nr:iron-sulfur cluster assembly scaffold protein [Chloroflexota bacterium]
MAAYSETVMDHFEHPRNAGEMDAPDGEATVRNPVCGDRMQVMLRIDEGRIAKMQWLTRGCPPAIATSSWTSERVEGWTLGEAEALTREAIAEGIGGLPSDKVHCSVLAADALKRAIADYRERTG